jgi:hypothetical protein
MKMLCQLKNSSVPGTKEIATLRSATDYIDFHGFTSSTKRLATSKEV